MTTVCAALLGSLLLAAPPKVGVVTVGEDAAAAGELQRAIELRLTSSRKATVLGATEVGAVLPAGAAPSAVGASRAVDPGLQKEAAAILQQATDAYYEDRAAVALDHLAALAALQDRTNAFPVGERVRLLLWRTAVFLALKDDAQSEAEALAALTLNPDLKVDLNEFRPSVKDAVDKARDRGFRTVTIVVSGLPAGAQLELDDRPVTAPFKTTIGRHRLIARAPGRREVMRVFEAAGDVSVPMSLPISSDASTMDLLAAISGTSEGTLITSQLIESIVTKLKLDWLVVAAVRADGNEARATLVSAKGLAVQSAPTGPAASVASWVEGRIAGGEVALAPVSTPRPAATATPRRAATPRPSVVTAGAPRARTPFAASAAGGLLWIARSRTLSGKEGGSFETSFGGVGPRVVIDAALGAPFARVEAAWVNYGVSTLDVTLPDGSKKKVTGGTTTLARLHAGWRHSFGRGEPDAAAAVWGSLGGSWESHGATDVRDASGDLGLLTSYQRTAVEVAAGGRVPFGGSMRPALSAGVIVSPQSTWTETPSDTSGTDPVAALSFGWNLGVDFQASAKIGISIDYAGAMRSIALKGAAQAPVDPELTDPTIDETFHSLGVTAGYRF